MFCRLHLKQLHPVPTTQPCRPTSRRRSSSRSRRTSASSPWASRAARCVPRPFFRPIPWTPLYPVPRNRETPADTPPRQTKEGVDAGPQALIEAGLVDQLRDDLGYKIHGDESIHYYTDLVPPPAEDPPYRNMKNPRSVSAVTEKIADQVYAHAREGRMVLTLGGDHSVAIGTVAGSAKAARERLGKEIAVVWVDAHADINTPELSDSGNVHGMPLGFLTGLAKEEKREYFGWLEEDNLISVKRLVYIGLRDVDAAEKKILKENGIKAFSMHDIDK